MREIRPGVFEGYSAALNLILRVEGGRLGWYDPDTGEHIPTFQSERVRAEAAESRTEAERAARVRAESRVQELEAEVRRLREGR